MSVGISFSSIWYKSSYFSEISIKSSGKITGEVFYENISIEEGAVVEAQVGKRSRENKIK